MRLAPMNSDDLTGGRYAQVLVDLACLTVLAEETAEDALSPHPDDLGGHAGLGGTLTLTSAGVTALALGSKESARAGTGVDGGGLDDDAAILDELLNVSARVGVANLRLLGGVEPDFALTDAGDGRGEALLRPEVDHQSRCKTQKTSLGQSPRTLSTVMTDLLMT